MDKSLWEQIQESRLYQSIIEEGVQRGKKQSYKDALLDLGTFRFGPPTFAVRLVFDLLDDLERLDRMAHRLLHAGDWDDLLNTPGTPEGGSILEASSTFQNVIEQGKEKGSKRVLRNLLLDLGTDRFGRPGIAVQATLGQLENLARLNRMVNRLLDAADWDDLLATP